jgi:hypothetical protein
VQPTHRDGEPGDQQRERVEESDDGLVEALASLVHRDAETLELHAGEPSAQAEDGTTTIEPGRMVDVRAATYVNSCSTSGDMV